MASHLRPLDRCRVCRAPATEALHNNVNDLVAVYCSRHAKAALREWLRRHL